LYLNRFIDRIKQDSESLIKNNTLEEINKKIENFTKIYPTADGIRPSSVLAFDTIIIIKNYEPNKFWL
jgi:hypothetical protein